MEADTSIAIAVINRFWDEVGGVSDDDDSDGLFGTADGFLDGGNIGGEVGETIDIQNVIKDVTVVSNDRVSDVIH